MGTLVRFRLAGVALGLSLSFISASGLGQQAVVLKGGAAVTVSGHLTIRGYGWQRFLVVETDKPYRLNFDSDDGGPTVVHEIAFYIAGQTDTVESLRGRYVTVTGKLQLNPPSPYYWKGTMLQAQSLRLASGEVLSAAKEAMTILPWPDGPKTFAVAITMRPDKLLPQYALLPTSNKPLAPPGFGCGVNGGGDLLNCTCPKGYAASRTGKIKDGRFLPLKKANVLQLEIGEDATHAVTVAAECTRVASH